MPVILWYASATVLLFTASACWVRRRANQP